MYNLPPANSPIRDMFDMEGLVSMLAPGQRHGLPTFNNALQAAPEQCKRLGAASINQVVVKANGTIALYRFGPRGSRKLVWQFSK